MRTHENTNWTYSPGLFSSSGMILHISYTTCPPNEACMLWIRLSNHLWVISKDVLPYFCGQRPDVHVNQDFNVFTDFLLCLLTILNNKFQK